MEPCCAPRCFTLERTIAFDLGRGGISDVLQHVHWLQDERRHVRVMEDCQPDLERLHAEDLLQLSARRACRAVHEDVRHQSKAHASDGHHRRTHGELGEPICRDSAAACTICYRCKSACDEDVVDGVVLGLERDLHRDDCGVRRVEASCVGLCNVRMDGLQMQTRQLCADRRKRWASTGQKMPASMRVCMQCRGHHSIPRQVTKTARRCVATCACAVV